MEHFLNVLFTSKYFDNDFGSSQQPPYEEEKNQRLRSRYSFFLYNAVILTRTCVDQDLKKQYYIELYKEEKKEEKEEESYT